MGYSGMSASQAWSGAVTVNWQVIRSSCIGAPAPAHLSLSAVCFGFRGLSSFQVAHCSVLAVPVAGLPLDRGGVLVVGGDRLIKPPHLHRTPLGFGFVTITVASGPSWSDIMTAIGTVFAGWPSR